VRPRDAGPETLRRLRRIADRAALVAAALGRQPSLVSCADVEIAAKAGTVPAAVSELVRALTEWGWIEGVGSARRLLVESGWVTALSWRLHGIADCASMDAGPRMVEPVITLPVGAKRLRAALTDELDAHATRDGFAHVAANARNRLVFLVPFIDATGADVLVRMLHSTPATERVIVVRPDSHGTRWYSPHQYWHLPVIAPSQAMRPETFHAKLAMADHELAYVGSSNLMASSLDDSLECGVLVRGESAGVFGALIDAVLAISTPVPPSD
jgi:hypothetical protein